MRTLMRHDKEYVVEITIREVQFNLMRRMVKKMSAMDCIHAFSIMFPIGILRSKEIYDQIKEEM